MQRLNRRSLFATIAGALSAPLVSKMAAPFNANKSVWMVEWAWPQRLNPGEFEALKFKIELDFMAEYGGQLGINKFFPIHRAKPKPDSSRIDPGLQQEKVMTDNVQTVVPRTSAGLRGALFDELDALRSGKSNAAKANATAKLAASIVATVEMELEVQRTMSKAKGEPIATAVLPSLTLASPAA